jgi:RNA polymerase sigma-70 factor (ECF subfamily)
MADELLEAFLRMAPATDSVAPEQLRPALDRALERARRVWPQVDIPSAQFSAFLGERVPAATPDGVAALRVEELYLTCGCLSRSTAALKAFEESYRPALMSAADRVLRDRVAADELVHDLWTVLILSEPPARAKLTDYQGTGSLRSWLSAVAARRAIDLLRAQGREAPSDAAVPLEETELGDLELDVLRTDYAAHFREAVEESFRELPLKERNALRLYYLDRIPLSQVSKMFHVDKSTLSRALASTRERVLERTRALLKDRLGVGSTDLDSLMRLLGSDLELSIERILKKG